MPDSQTTSARPLARSWFRARAIAEGEAEISIYDEIGLWGITAKDFQRELKALGQVAHIALRINSPGGDVFDGVAIYNMLKRHKARITVNIDGLAASMASVVAMAGDDVIMPENAMMMIHDPIGGVIGTSKDMRDIAVALDKVKQGMVSAYAAKSGADPDEIGRLMAEETWLTAEEALELGFADAVEEEVAIAARFDLRRFHHPPSGLIARNKQEDPMQGTSEQKPGAADAERGATATASQHGGQPAKPEEEEATPPAGQQPAATAAPAAVPADERQRIVAEERKRAADIHRACNLVGRHDLAAGFVADGKTLGDVVAALQESRANASSAGSGGEIATRSAGAGGTQKPGQLSARMKRLVGTEG